MAARAFDLIALLSLAVIGITVMRHLREITIFITTVLLTIAEVKDRMGILGFLILLAILVFCSLMVIFSEHFVEMLLRGTTTFMVFRNVLRTVLLPRAEVTKKHMASGHRRAAWGR